MRSFRIQTDDGLTLEVYRVDRQPDGTYRDGKDPDDPSRNSPATVIDDTMAAPIAAEPGQFFVVKVG